MNAQEHNPSHILAPDMPSARTDLATEAIINEAIGLISTGGTARAAEHLRNHNVSMELALRVLSQPSQRRRYDG